MQQINMIQAAFHSIYILKIIKALFQFMLPIIKFKSELKIKLIN